ncbi:MAG: A/G-specific adenine glycosylase [Bacteroidaceae bacterium]|nr:A/G-specific adenine glycosylase [Bacteroidaceae bacterium]
MISTFTTALLDWFAHYGRELPWRQTRDPYAIWLSEVILQQTRIQQGRDYWARFMQRFPMVELLAVASEDEVLRLWQGLGYYSRARNLHKAAQQVVAMGAFPSTLEGIRSLQGVGDYTAAAVASIAFDVDAAAVDGNVYRVLSRYYGVATPINTPQGKRDFTQLASSLLPAGKAGTFNQALMDFGAIQCTPRSPRCVICPLVETCEAVRSGRVGELPVKRPKTKVQERRLAYIYIRYKGKVAIHRRGPGDIWQGLWEPLLMEGDALFDTAQPMVLLAKDVRHVLTHRILLADFYLVEAKEKPSLPEDYQWIDESELDRYAKPRLVERLLERLPD